MAVAQGVAGVPEFTVEQLEQMLKAKKDQAKQNGPEMRKKLEAYCLKEFGMSLASVISSTRKAPTSKTYKNKETGETFTWAGMGSRYPEWLQTPEQKKACLVS